MTWHDMAALQVLKFFVGQIYELVELPRVMADDGSDEDAGEPDLLVRCHPMNILGLGFRVQLTCVVCVCVYRCMTL